MSEFDHQTRHDAPALIPILDVILTQKRTASEHHRALLHAGARRTALRAAHRQCLNLQILFHDSRSSATLARFRDIVYHICVSELRYLNELQTAEFLEVQRSTLRRWRALSKGPRWARIGRRVVYLLEDIESWLRSSVGSQTGN
jgi:predicted DNA-binding transcriptional regulator AlpA